MRIAPGRISQIELALLNLPWKLPSRRCKLPGWAIKKPVRWAVDMHMYTIDGGGKWSEHLAEIYAWNPVEQ